MQKDHQSLACDSSFPQPHFTFRIHYLLLVMATATEESRQQLNGFQSDKTHLEIVFYICYNRDKCRATALERVHLWRVPLT
jgi:hypothetical protein